MFYYFNVSLIYRGKQLLLHLHLPLQQLYHNVNCQALSFAYLLLQIKKIIK